jgi:hypothetical protein
MDQNSASWNRIGDWLRRLEGLKQASSLESSTDLGLADLDDARQC